MHLFNLHFTLRLRFPRFLKVALLKELGMEVSDLERKTPKNGIT